MTMPKLRKQVKTLVIGNSKEDSDWIREGKLKKYREEELKLHDELAKKNKKK